MLITFLFSNSSDNSVSNKVRSQVYINVLQIHYCLCNNNLCRDLYGIHCTEIDLYVHKCVNVDMVKTSVLVFNFCKESPVLSQCNRQRSSCTIFVLLTSQNRKKEAGEKTMLRVVMM